MDHRFSQLFGAGLAAPVPNCYCVGDAIVLDDHRVIYRYIRGALFEITNRIATSFHHIADEPIGFPYCAFRVIDKSGLLTSPRLRESTSVFG